MPERRSLARSLGAHNVATVSLCVAYASLRDPGSCFLSVHGNIAGDDRVGRRGGTGKGKEERATSDNRVTTTWGEGGGAEGARTINEYIFRYDG